MAGEDNFEIRIVGRGGHASQPQMVVDPMVVAAQVVLALQTIVARNIHPAETAVVSCTEILTDGARNAIPSEVVIRGDIAQLHRPTSGRSSSDGSASCATASAPPTAPPARSRTPTSSRRPSTTPRPPRSLWPRPA